MEEYMATEEYFGWNSTGFTHPASSVQRGRGPCGDGSPVRRRAIVSEDADGVDMQGPANEPIRTEPVRPGWGPGGGPVLNVGAHLGTLFV